MFCTKKKYDSSDKKIILNFGFFQMLVNYHLDRYSIHTEMYDSSTVCTYCPKSMDPFYTVTYYKKMGQDF